MIPASENSPREAKTVSSADRRGSGVEFADSDGLGVMSVHSVTDQNFSTIGSHLLRASRIKNHCAMRRT
jgi:hypothetical protein